MTIETAKTANGIPSIKETIGTPGWRARRATSRYLGQTIASAVAMTAAAAVAMIAASQVRSGSPWSGLNAMAAATGLGPARTRRRFDRNATVAGAGVLAGGLLLIAALYQGARRAVGQRHSGRALAPAR